MSALSYADQLVEGSFEHALDDLVEQRLELTRVEGRYANDETGCPVYDLRGCCTVLQETDLDPVVVGDVSAQRSENSVTSPASAHTSGERDPRLVKPFPMSDAAPETELALLPDGTAGQRLGVR
jgi:hypothetical protein